MWSYRGQTEACSQSITAIPCHCVSLSFSPRLCLPVGLFRSTPACFITGLLVGLIRARVTVSGPESQRVASDRGENGLTDRRKMGFKQNLPGQFPHSHFGSWSVTAEIHCFYPHSISTSWHAGYNVSQISWMYSIQSSTLREHMLPSCAPLKPRQRWKLLTGPLTAKTPQLTSGRYIPSIHLGRSS